MGKIVKLKNKKTGERVYPVTATKAVVDADSGERLNDTLLNKVEEAPVDGNQYVRINGTWGIAQMATSTKEKCIITLASNQGESDAASLYGATVKVTNVDTDETYYDDSWNGTEIVIELAAGINYKIEVGDVENYATPESKTLTALEFNVRNFVMMYNTELVSVTLSSDDGASVVGQVVTINDKTHTWNGTAITQKIAFGKTYTVEVNDKAGYITSSSQSFTAMQSSRSLQIVYYAKTGTLEPEYGVYIQDIEGYCYTESEWDNRNIPNGIAVITEKCRVVMALENSPSELEWGGYGTEISGVTTTVDGSTALGDYDGEAQTTIIIETLKGTNDGYVDGAPAAEYCRNYTFPNGQEGYLGSAGEWQAVADNISAVISAIEKCGCGKMLGYYWTSTQYNSNRCWFMFWASTILMDKDKYSSSYVRPFTTI